MNIRNILLALVLALLGINFYIHSNNKSLAIAISDEQNLCNEWLAKLSQKNKQTPLVEIESKTQTNQLASTQQNKVEEFIQPETDLDTLVSHTHRLQAVYHKYEFLLLTAQIEKNEKNRLKRLLLNRERLTNALVVAEQEEKSGQQIGEIEDKLYNIEDQIELVLNDPLDYHRYELIKQRQL